MFYLWLADAEPNSNYGEWVAAAYEHDQAAWEADPRGQETTEYAASAERAMDAAWDRMVDRNA